MKNLKSYLSKKLFINSIVVLNFILLNNIIAQEVQFKEDRVDSKLNLILANQKISFTVTLEGKNLISDKIATQRSWAKDYNSSETEFETNGDFAFDLMFTDWRAPGKQNNADNPALLNKKYFDFSKYIVKNIEDGEKELILFFKGKEMSLGAEVHYQLSQNDFYVRKKIYAIDSADIGHFLRNIYPVYSVFQTRFDIVKKGDFGQPAAVTSGSGGVFWGIEYPGSTNEIIKTEDKNDLIKCGQELGERIGAKPIEGEWCVIGISPNEYIKKWFMKYIDDIRIKKLEPFTLYNSWYDLRSAEYPKVPKENIMNEENSLRIISLLKTNMIEKNDIKLDAFVLDDGWDIYRSDWVLRDKQFPKGFTPLVNELKKTNTALGVWFGPTGGYSFRMERINWMKEHGYETVGKGRDNEMLCLAGKKYSALFEKRVSDLIKNYNVGFYKWDGIQFSCSEPSHGHALDIYSRRALIESVIAKIKTVRQLNPGIFLNITSGTWLSPWWVKYSNQIWMDGGDYGYADVPSISPRDAAITYRDMVLYEDFAEKDLWFPIANLMTHGIIKGKLQMLGGEDEPIEKFTDESLIYFARGVSMWELYISPDIMKDNEWNAMSKSIHWARDRFSILKNTFMVGGDPKKGEPYAYVHFNGSKGIIAARNPLIQKNEITVKLDPAFGFADEVDSLVVERTYPTRWIAPKLYSSGDKINLELEAFETSVYEVYPIMNADRPLIAGVLFNENNNSNEIITNVYGIIDRPLLLNSSMVESITIADSTYKLDDISFPELKQIESIKNKTVRTESEEKLLTVSAEITIDSTVVSGEISILIKPSEDFMNKQLPELKFYIHDEEVKPKMNDQKGRWSWFTLPIKKGLNSLKIKIASSEKVKTWNGTAAFWFLGNQEQKKYSIKIISKNNLTKRIMPPLPFKQEQMRKTILIDEVTLKLAD